MTYSEMVAAVEDAKRTLNRSDQFVAQMAEMIAGRLRKGDVSCIALRKLKEELRDYNIHTSSWRK